MKLDKLGLPWHFKPWGDGSSPDGHGNICSDSFETVIAKDLPKEVAEQMIDAMNLLQSLQPRPIEEAPPTDVCNDVIGIYSDGTSPRMVYWFEDEDWDERDDEWKSRVPPVGYKDFGDKCIPINQPTHFLPSSAITALMELMPNDK